ncbi:uncharacterized protein LOC133927326 [Phragmites australis]|uniref:uncharacterized protein LOC133927326 n=1 Tax=Phragmites australis TaxID=29695 RepID=UPI002D767B25|nr:uncharacterized protein LOC133927326 [Phragmites australis]
MGCGFSSSSSGSLRPCAGVRVIHTNGYVEDFHGPGVVTVAHVTGSTSKDDTRYVLCSSAHLLEPGRGPFRPDDPLQPGTVYFLLPHSVFQSESSAVDLACLMNRLTALARKGGSSSAPTPSPVEALFAATSHRQQEQQQQPVVVVKAKNECGASGRPAPWRPCLDRIDESIGRASMRSASSRSACSEA